MKEDKVEDKFVVEYNGIAGLIRSKVRIVNTDNGGEYICDALWDTGSECTIISPSIASVLNVELDGKTKIMSATGCKEARYASIALYIKPIFIEKLRVSVCDVLGGAKVIIGMDIISRGNMAITIAGGRLSFHLRCRLKDIRRQSCLMRRKSF